MRIVHTFIYNGKKSFRAGELTVGDYYLFLRDPEYAIVKVLSEYNREVPKLNASQLDKFLDVYLWGSTDPIEKLGKVLERNVEKDRSQVKQYADDFHIQYLVVSKLLGFDVQDMPMTIFSKALQDMDIITGRKQYDKNRHSKTPDRSRFHKELWGAKGALLHKSK